MKLSWANVHRQSTNPPKLDQIIEIQFSHPNEKQWKWMRSACVAGVHWSEAGNRYRGQKRGWPDEEEAGTYTHTHTYPYRRSVERRVISSREHAGVNKPGTPVGLRSPSSSHQRASSPRSFAFRIDAATPDTAHDLSATGLTQLRAGFAETVWLNDSLNWAVIWIVKAVLCRLS